MRSISNTHGCFSSNMSSNKLVLSEPIWHRRYSLTKETFGVPLLGKGISTPKYASEGILVWNSTWNFTKACTQYVITNVM
jgi:hypothetical protein